MDGEIPSRKDLLLLAVVLEGGIGVVAVFLGWWWGHPPLATCQGTLLSLLWGGLAVGPMLLLLAATVSCPIWPFPGILRVVDEFMVPMFRPCRVIDLAIISGLAGLGEEMLFRGVIQEGVAQWVGEPSGMWVGLAIGALVFGLAHPVTFGYVLFAAATGVYLGGIWILSGNLLVPIVAHAVYDFLALVYLVKFRAVPLGLAPDDPTTALDVSDTG